MLSNEGARALWRAAKEIEAKAASMQAAAAALFKEARLLTHRPTPGSTVLDVRTGKLGVVKLRQSGDWILEEHTDAGEKPFRDPASYDIVELAPDLNAIPLEKVWDESE